MTLLPSRIGVNFFQAKTEAPIEAIIPSQQFTPQKPELDVDGICSLCVRAIDILREARRRLDRFPVSSYASEAAMGVIGDGLAKVEEAHSLLEQILSGTEPDDLALEYYMRVIEDR